MSIEFRAVSVERAVEIMRVWASRRWPLSVEEGVSAYTSLGFHSPPDDRTLFTSDMSPTRADSYFVVEGNRVAEGSLRLSNWVPEECWADSLPKSRAIFAEYVRAYTGALGEPFSSEDEGTDFSCRWILDNMVTIELAGNEAFLELSFDSPEGTADLLDEIAMEERGETIGEDYF